jgi:hypothetical protein
MTGQKKDKPSQGQAKSEARQTRLGAELRANLLKRKAQAKAKEPLRDRDEGGQS